MGVVSLSAPDQVATARGDTVIRIVVPATPEQLRRCLAGVLAHTAPTSVRVLVVDDGHGCADAERVVRETVAESRTAHEILFATDPSVDLAPAELVLVEADVVVGPGWLERLADAVRGDLRVATASLVGSDGDPTTELDAPVSGCVWVTRSALELVGEFAPEVPADLALASFAAGCLAHGLRHVQVMVPVGDEGLSVTIDGRCLSASVTGTAAVVIELVAGLSAREDIRVRVLVLEDLDRATMHLLESVGASAVTVAEAERAGPTDIAHRPYQLGVVDDLLVLGRLGRRVVVTHLDSIGYRTAAHFEDEAQWHAYRELTQASLVAADGVVFLSEDAAADARGLGLVDHDRAAVIGLGVDTPISSEDRNENSPLDMGLATLAGRPYLLCLGTDFAHKNRPFAIRLLDALLEQGLFDGALVLAGPHVDTGSSASEEAAELARRPHLRERVLDVGTVSETEKRRLLHGAAAAVYPTTYEGFGLIPFEAARLGVPTLFAATSSLRDLLGPEVALITAWDADDSARHVAPVLAPGVDRDRLVQAIAAVGATLGNAENARRHVELYERARGRPARAATAVVLRGANSGIEAQRLRADVVHARARLAEIERDPLLGGFVGEDPLVPAELQRAALAIAARPVPRRFVNGIYRLARAVSRLARHRGSVSP